GEFPLLSWAMALGYRIFGYHEQIGRILVLLASLGSIWAFYRLALKLLAPLQAKLALLFFAYSPILVNFAANIQPDPIMLLAVILCMDYLLDWLGDRRMKRLILCGILGALAILLKLPAVYIGIVLALTCLEKF